MAIEGRLVRRSAGDTFQSHIKSSNPSSLQADLNHIGTKQANTECYSIFKLPSRMGSEIARYNAVGVLETSIEEKHL
jgi:hypothetical protein